MHRTPPSQFCRGLGRAALGLLALCGGLAATPALAQQQPRDAYYRFSGTTPPGVIGQWALLGGAPLRDYYQPVEIKGPAGLQVAVAVDGDFTQLEPAPSRFGLLIAPVYRFRVTNIPNQEGLEVFPTVELIDRTYPPCGQALQFPIPIDLTEEDLNLALAGKFVTKVIYVEDPQKALPVVENRNTGRWYDAGPTANPLLVADQQGRPVAILRMGGRTPHDNMGGWEPSLMGSGAALIKFPPRPPQKFIEPGPPGGPDAPPAQPPAEAEKTTRRGLFPREGRPVR
jgi:hypothetical protein